LLNTCVSHLPKYLVAAYAKKLARVALSVPPQTAVYIISLIYDLILRHPDIRVLIHRKPQFSSTNTALLLNLQQEEQEEQAKLGNDIKPLDNTHVVFKGVDCFDMNAEDPKDSRALESSMWELEALGQHYSPMVTGFVQMFKDRIKDANAPVFPKPDSFMTVTYDSLFEEEQEKITKEFLKGIQDLPFDYRQSTDLLSGAVQEDAFSNFKF